MTDDVGLHKDLRTLWVEPTGDVLGNARKRIFAQLGGRIFHRDRVHVDDTEVALVIIEHGRPILDRTEVVPDRQLTGRLGAGENNWLCFAH